MTSVLRNLTVSCAIALLARAASAQTNSTSTASIIGVANSVNGGGLTPISQAFGNGASTPLAGSQSFTGMSGSGASRTLTFSGTCLNSSEYGRLHAYASGQLANSYYNAQNAVYADGKGGIVDSKGSPDAFASLGFSDFDDTLQFGGILASGYKARYVFHVDGTNSGDLGAADLADLSVQIGGDAPEAFFSTSSGRFETDWATIDHPINGQTPQHIFVQFSNQVVFNTFDGSLADGNTYSGISDFSATLTLAQIVIVDANGSPVDGVTVSSTSGTSYRVYSTPEPASFAALGVGALALLRRSRRATPR